MAKDSLKVQFTIIDSMIIESYKTIVDGLAEYLGKNYEIVLHSLSNLDNSVVYIKNGFHTGRTVGAPITNMALEMLSKIDKNSINDVTYFTKDKNGEPVKSSTIAIRGEHNKIIGLLWHQLFSQCTHFWI
nr:PAS domain-containing protein [uncultured Sphaerochaeta sp.]